MVHNILFYTLEIGNYQNNPLLASIWLAVITRIHKAWEENLFYLSAHPSPSGWRARLSSHTAEDKQMSHQDDFLHIQQHRGAAGDFVLLCKGRRKEKRISFACNFTSSTETMIERRLGWQNALSLLSDRTCSCCFWVLQPGEPESRVEHTWCKLTGLDRPEQRRRDAEKMWSVLSLLHSRTQSVWLHLT